jgi:hypothetical protein
MATNSNKTAAPDGVTKVSPAESVRDRPRITDCDNLLGNDGTQTPASQSTPDHPQRTTRYVSYPLFIPPEIEPVPPPVEPPIEPPIEPPVDPPDPPEPPPPLYTDGFYDTFEEYNVGQGLSMNQGYNWESGSSWIHHRTDDETHLLEEKFEGGVVGQGFSSVVQQTPRKWLVAYETWPNIDPTYPPQENKYVNMGGNAMCRKFLASYVGAWTEMWLVMHWSWDILISEGVALDPLYNNELLWAFGLQRGTAATFNADESSVPHMVGLKGQPYASVDTVTDVTAGALDYAKPYTEGFKIESGVQTSQGVQGTFNVAGSGQDVRNNIVLRILPGSPNWTIAWLRPTTELAVSQDVTNNTVVNMFNSTDWADLKTYLSTYSEDTYTVAVDTAANGDFDSVFFSWPHYYAAVRWGAIYGRVFLT